MNDLNPIDAGQGEVPSSPESSAPPESGAPTGGTPVAAAPSAPDQLYDVKIGGQTRRVPLNELLSGYSRTQDYTQKTMALAEERRQFETRWNTERTQIREFLSRPENVEQLLSHLRQSQPQPGQTPTVTPQHLQQLQQQFEARLAQERQSMALEQETNGYRNEIAGHIGQILEQFPELKSVRNVEMLLKNAALAQDPADIHEAKRFILAAAQEQATAIRDYFTTAQKQAVTNKATLARGIEPPGGAAPMPMAKAPGKMGSPEFNQDVSNYFRQLTEAAKA